MKKQDEIEFFWYLIAHSEVSPWSGYLRPGREKIELFDMPDKRKIYLLEKWFRNDIWNCGGWICSGWFEKEAIENFTRDRGIAND
jgi:hypothetical protein